MSIQSWLSILFVAIIGGFLIVDLGFLNKKSHKVEFKSAVYQSLFWVAVSLIFGALIYFFESRDFAAEFLSAYVTEKMLSVDNLFVIMLIFRFFKVDERYHHRVLYWGILGAVVFRGITISAGSLIIAQFHWVLYLFGALLVYSGIKLLFESEDEEQDFNDNRVVQFAKKYLPITTKDCGDKFFDRPFESAYNPATGYYDFPSVKFYFTMLFVVLLLVEVTDIIFAMDSIPAVFAISQHPFIVFTSNIFAIMGLRALFFVVENILNRFHHLQKGVSFILVFIGAKMLVSYFGVHISSLLSFGVILCALAVSVLASLLSQKK